MENTEEKQHSEEGALFITIVIAVLLIGVAAIVGYNVGRNNPIEEDIQGFEIPLLATDKAKELNLDLAEVDATVNLESGYAEITIRPEEGFFIPEGSTIEGFLVDAGTLGNLGVSSESPRDEFFGPSLSNAEDDDRISQSPYALSIGRVLEDKESGELVITFENQVSLVPYDQIILTLESDDGIEDYDPRPGAIIYSGELTDSIKPRDAIEQREELNETPENQ